MLIFVFFSNRPLPFLFPYLPTYLLPNFQGRTALLIAHRWSSIQIADRIAVLGDGKVIEIGTPQDLLSTSTDSAFRRLVRRRGGKGDEDGLGGGGRV